MNVALVIERMDVRRGGREASTAQIASHLAARGIEVSVLCMEGVAFDDRVTVRPLAPAEGTRLRRLDAFLADVGAEIARGDYDIVHATLPVPGANVYQPRGGTLAGQRAASLRRRGPVGKLLAAAGWVANPLRRRLRRLERRLLADPDVLCLAVSEMVAAELRIRCRRSENVAVVYNAADVPPVSRAARASDAEIRRKLLGVGEGDPVFVTLATNFELKGVRQLLRAFALFHRRRGAGNARLVAAGRNEPARYALLADRLGLTGKVDFPGCVDNPHPWYWVATATVLLSWYDPCSRTVLESLRWGVPAITTRHNGAAEVLEDGAGIVVDSPAEVSRVADAMEAMTDRRVRSRAVEACHALDERLSMKRHVDELVGHYQSLLARR